MTCNVVHIEIASIVGAFYRDLAFMLISSLQLIEPSWFKLQFFLSLEPNEELLNNSRSFRDWLWIVLAVGIDCTAEKKITVEEADHIAPIISTKEKSVAQTGHVWVNVTGIFYPICPIGETLRGSLFT